MSHPRNMFGDQTPIAASLDQRTAARRGRKSCFAAIKPALAIWKLMGPILMFCMPACGRFIENPGRWKAEVRAVAFLNQPMAAIRGLKSRETRDCPRA